ncbi:MAG: hypothetical protein WDN46_20550 [Methylocella sp.]
MSRAEYQLRDYWALMTEIKSVKYAAKSYERFCVRNELQSLFEGPPWMLAAPRLAKLCRDAFDATFVQEFGVDGAAAGRAEHERLDAELLTAMEDEGREDRACKAWRRQFALMDKRRARAA